MGENVKVEEIPESLIDDLDEFSLSKKKKKSKKKAFNIDDFEKTYSSSSAVIGDGEGSGEQVVSNDSGIVTGGGGGGEGVDTEAVDEDDDFELNLPKTKPKKIKFVDDDLLNDGDQGDKDEPGVYIEENSARDAVGITASVDASWANTDRDYLYEELLARAFYIIKEKNPDIISGEKKRLVMRPPQILRVGTKKTSFANFLDICKSLHRQPKHLQAFLLAELGTSGSVDANNQLIIKGRFQQKQIENVLRRYIKEYVACQTCRSPDTVLQKDTRLFFLQCETCGSRRSVTSIKSGFQAVTGKRAAIRAKTA
ncbi:eukaryotic translation initiation factor 2 subunit 2-like [Panonychus citri]|uniref:eukaryotic translation initiation factor 2 subunit 2-like n=1 Tax=Panonychus citri TaxID=50023 RepID=UPI002307FF95|nr:eukaryotic translation initiation factor 2 subunit 2-like [Panonychus citri]